MAIFTNGSVETYIEDDASVPIRNFWSKHDFHS